MSFDPGARRIGVALCDPTGLLAEGIATLEVRTPEEALARIRALVAEHRPERLVVGHPIHMNGSAGPAARRAARLARVLREATGLPVDLWDERATSAEAREVLRTTGRGRRARLRREDQAAAAILLEAYLAAHPDCSAHPG